MVGVRAGEFGRRDPVLGKENIDIINSLADEDKVRPYICGFLTLKILKKHWKYLENRNDWESSNSYQLAFCFFGISQSNK